MANNCQWSRDSEFEVDALGNVVVKNKIKATEWLLNVAQRDQVVRLQLEREYNNGEEKTRKATLF
jgi:hypothetical protein